MFEIDREWDFVPTSMSTKKEDIPEVETEEMAETEEKPAPPASIEENDWQEPWMGWPGTRSR